MPTKLVTLVTEGPAEAARETPATDPGIEGQIESRWPPRRCDHPSSQIQAGSGEEIR
jgi:hypothetical protein